MWIPVVVAVIALGLLSASLLGFEFGAVIALVAVMVYVFGAIVGPFGDLDGGD